MPHATAHLPPLKPAPDLTLIDWDPDASLREAASSRSVSGGAEYARRRMRDRYIAARFPGLASCAADLVQVDDVIKSARLLFEDGQGERALELLELAAMEAPREPALGLARLELLFLMRDAPGFLAAAQAFHRDHPHEAWPEIQRLGRALSPKEPMFGGVSGPRPHEHYGPWPHLPNWIRAPWDLTSEVLSADFHRALTGVASVELALAA